MGKRKRKGYSERGEGTEEETPSRRSPTFDVSIHLPSTPASGRHQRRAFEGLKSEGIAWVTETRHAQTFGGPVCSRINYEV
jgi:hypothetical protein